MPSLWQILAVPCQGMARVIETFGGGVNRQKKGTYNGIPAEISVDLSYRPALRVHAHKKSIKKYISMNKTYQQN